MSASVRETKTFDWRVVATALSGCNWCEFEYLHELAEWIVGHPLWTHEFARKATWDQIKEGIFSQYPDLRNTDWNTLRESHREPTLVDVGNVLNFTFTQGNQQRTQSPIETLQELAPGKPVIVVTTGDK